MPGELVLLTDEELRLLGPEELAAYLAYLEHEAGAWVLTGKQRVAEDLTADCHEVGYGGAAGGGKSDWGLWHVYHLSMKYPRHRSLVLRTVLPELRRSLIARSLQKFDQSNKNCWYRPGEKEWHFANGSVIEFGYLDKDDDVYQYKSAEYDCIFFDEATELSEFGFGYLRSRCRTTTLKRRLGVRPHIIAATNPGGKGHGWFKRHFVKATNYGERIAEVEVKDPITDRVAGVRKVGFVPATLLDNPHIDPEYKLNLLSLPSEVERRQLLYGDWDVFAGQFFDQFSYPVHVVRPFAIPSWWTRTRGIDYGFAAPFACLWVTFDPDGWGYVYREAYERRLTAYQQADLVLERSKQADGRPEDIAYTVADPSIWTRQGSGDSIAGQYRSRGLIARKAKNARKDGWSCVREWIRPAWPDPEGRVDANGVGLLLPRLRMFPSCENLLRTLPELIHDKDDPEDLDTTQEDHAADALRYDLMSRPRLPKPDVSPKALSEDERIWKEMAELAAAKAGGRGLHPVLGRA